MTASPEPRLQRGRNIGGLPPWLVTHQYGVMREGVSGGVLGGSRDGEVDGGGAAMRTGAHLLF